MLNKKDLLAFVVAASGSIINTQAVEWDGGGDGWSWDTANNWDNNLVPAPGAAIVFNAVTPPIGNAFADTEVFEFDRVIALIDNKDYAISSLSFGSSLTGSMILFPAAGESFSLSGAITNSSAFKQTLQIPVNATAGSTWSGNLEFTNTVNIGQQTINIGLGSVFDLSATLRFEILNTTTYGKFTGTAFTADYSGVTINVLGSYTGIAGDSFDFTTGNFADANIGVLPALGPNLVWDTSQFISQGILTVQAIPEPSTVAILAGFAALGYIGTRRRNRARA